MIEQQGKVVGLANGKAMVRIGPTAGCAACDAGRGCGAGIFGRLLRRKTTTMPMSNSIGASVGQVVTIGIPETVFLRLLVRFYLLPVVAGLAGAVIGHHLIFSISTSPGFTDAGAVAGAIVFAGLVLWISRGRQAISGNWSGMRLLKFITTENNEVNTCTRKD